MIISDAKELFYYEPNLQCCKLPGILIGDYERLKYILFFLIKFSIKRTCEYHSLELVTVRAYMTDALTIDLFEIDFDT